MRRMESVRFCAPCVENIWILFLDQISLIDGVAVESSGGGFTATVHTPQLGQLRPEPPDGEALGIAWYRGEEHLPEHDGQFTLSVPAGEAGQSYRVEVTLVTPEVRKDTGSVLKDTHSFRVGSAPARSLTLTKFGP
jgi:hypothetical protein